LILKKKKDITKDQLREWLTDEDGHLPGEEELQQTEDALLCFAEAHAVPPPPDLREHLLTKLKSLNEQKKNRKRLQLHQLPLLDANANWYDWEEAVGEIEPPDYDDIYLHPLEETEQRSLFVAWVNEYIPEEVHHDLIESFLLLEGSCECHISDEAGNVRIVRLSQGDYIEMQLGETHDIFITSAQPAKAILQWLRLSA
jgi:mannose-6-phosphate isomerase-like protein (cupin superfamily)